MGNKLRDQLVKDDRGCTACRSQGEQAIMEQVNLFGKSKKKQFKKEYHNPLESAERAWDTGLSPPSSLNKGEMTRSGCNA